jgi:hypothetical protein
VVMPYGHDDDEIDWYTGWYQQVIYPAVVDCGYDPVLSANENRPNAINDDIRLHLAYDPMVVVDLGGVTADSLPNSNVMYEYGVRHALDLPLVAIAWKGQRLPFDVANQRIMMEKRRLIDINKNRERLIEFLRAARAGEYYKPMSNIARIAALDVASASLDQNTILGALVAEVRALREKVEALRAGTVPVTVLSDRKTAREFLANAALRKAAQKAFLDAGGTHKEWGVLIDARIPVEMRGNAENWNPVDWLQYFMRRRDDIRQATRADETKTTIQAEAPTPSTAG